jgi:hypothetical protein
MMKFRVRLHGILAKEYIIEANDSWEASGIVKIKFPGHLGYSIEPAN